MPADFEWVAKIIDQQPIAQSLSEMADLFRQKKLFPQWFETLKMIARQHLGLPPLKNQQQAECLDASTELQLENRLLDACCEVGLALWEEGQWEHGWSFLQPVANRRQVVDALHQIVVDTQNIDFVIHVALAEGVAPALGFRWLLDKYGTCDGITTFDTQGGRFGRWVQSEMASLLLNRIYQELWQNIQANASNAAVAENNAEIELSSSTLTSSRSDPSTGLADLLNQWEVSGGCGLFIDATHLASVVRIARLCQQPADWKKGAELCRYGRLLPADLQYPSPPPFENTFDDHQVFFHALLGEDVELATERITEKCQQTDPDSNNTQIAFETLIDFLVRVGRRPAAIEVFAQQILGQHIPLGIAPSITEIAQTSDELACLGDRFRQRDDLLGFAICQLLQKECNASAE